MPIVYRDPDLFATGCEALVNPVNCAGVMGRGLALAFKRRYPAHFAAYPRACRAGALRPGAVARRRPRPRRPPALPRRPAHQAPLARPRSARRRRALRARPRRGARRTPHRLGRHPEARLRPRWTRLARRPPRHRARSRPGCCRRLPHRPPRPPTARAGPGAARGAGDGQSRTHRGGRVHPRRREPGHHPDGPRYVIRTVDEDWLDLFDAPARIGDKRAAWDEAKRRVRAHPECTTLVIDRRTGTILWRSEPDIAPRYEVLAVDPTVFYALETDRSLVGDVLSTHKVKDDAWTAFHAAIEESVGNDIIVLRDTTPSHAILASSDDDRFRTDAASGP